MVEYHVHHHFQSLCMSLVNESFVFGVRSESRVYAIIVGGSITMISGESIVGIRRVVFQYRRKPQCRNAQFIKIVKVLAHAFQVASMSQGWFCTVFLIGVESLHSLHVSFRLCESIRHEHIQDVCIRKTDALFATHLSLFQRI